MANPATDYLDLTRICGFTRRLHQLHRLGGEDAIDREFGAVCRAIWGFTLDDFTVDVVPEVVTLLRREVDRALAVELIEPGVVLHGGCVAGWWGFTWMILAEARGVLTPEKRATAWCRHGEKTWWA